MVNEQEAYEFAEVVEFLSLTGSQLVRKIVSGLGATGWQEFGFEDDDPIEQHFTTANSQGIREIIKPLATLMALSANYERTVGVINSLIQDIIKVHFSGKTGTI